MNTMDGMDETEIIPLHKSVKVGEITYETLTLREPTAATRKSLTSDHANWRGDFADCAGRESAACGDRALMPAGFEEDFGFFGTFQRGCPRNLGDAVAELTKFYGWGPRTAWSLTVSELIWWFEQAQRMSQSKEDRA